MKWWEKLRFRLGKLRVKTWVLVLIFITGILTSAFFLRQNNLKMIELRQAVVKADESGGDVKTTLEKLNYHVFHHMNTEIVRPIELVQTYERQSKIVIEEANKSSGRDIYAEATKACEARGVPLTSVAQCAADYAVANNPGVGPKEIKLPDRNLFTYTYAPPAWTPDLAGFSVLITGVAGVLLIGILIEFIIVRLLLRLRLGRNFS